MKQALFAGLAGAVLMLSPLDAMAQARNDAGNPMLILKQMSEDLKAKPSFSLTTTSFYDQV